MLPAGDGSIRAAEAGPSGISVLVERESPAPAAAVDPAATAAAVSAALPAIPPEQRRPLAAVFQALADALESAEG